MRQALAPHLRHLYLFLDYDGTLTPIVPDPREAWLTTDMRMLVRQLQSLLPVAIISGRALADLQLRVGIEGIVYAGSHGFEIALPGQPVHRVASEFLPLLQVARDEIAAKLAHVPGVYVEPVKVSLSVHYRQAGDKDIAQVEAAVDALVQHYPQLKKTYGKKVFEIKPNVDWHKGRAVEWILKRVGQGRFPVYLGDDITDEDAFAVLRNRGMGVLVAETPHDTLASAWLGDQANVKPFLQWLRTHIAA